MAKWIDNKVDEVLFPNYHSYQNINELQAKAQDVCRVLSVSLECIRIFEVDVEGVGRVPCAVAIPQHQLNTSTSGVAVLWLKGNYEDLGDDLGYFLKLAISFDAPVLVPEYPGYGSAPGKSNVSTIDTVAQKAQLLGERLFPDSKFIFCGRSVGCGPAVFACQRALHTNTAKVLGLITISAWSSLKQIRWYTGLASERWDSLAVAPAITVPWCIIHGTADDIIPFYCAEALFAAAPNGVLLQLSGQGHNDSLIFSAPLVVARSFAAELAGDPYVKNPTATVQPSLKHLVFCHGYNCTVEYIDELCRAIQSDLGSVPVAKVGWFSVAGEAQGVLNRYGSRSIAAKVTSPSYSIDSSRQHAISIPEGTSLILAHSHGCRILIEWLMHNHDRWDAIERIALVHPDVAADSLQDDNTITAFTHHKNGFSAGLSRRLNDVLEDHQRLADLLSKKVAVFDTSHDFATSTAAFLGGIGRKITGRSAFGASRDIGPLSSLHIQAEGTSHNLWLTEETHRRTMLSWLTDGHANSSELPPNCRIV